MASPRFPWHAQLCQQDRAWTIDKKTTQDWPRIFTAPPRTESPGTESPSTESTQRESMAQFAAPHGRRCPQCAACRYGGLSETSPHWPRPHPAMQAGYLNPFDYAGPYALRPSMLPEPYASPLTSPFASPFPSPFGTPEPAHAMPSSEQQFESDAAAGYQDAGQLSSLAGMQATLALLADQLSLLEKRVEMLEGRLAAQKGLQEA